MRIHASDADHFPFGFKRWRNKSAIDIRCSEEQSKSVASKASWKLKSFITLMYIVAAYITACQMYISTISATSRVSLRALTVSTKAIFGTVSVHIVSLVYGNICKRLKEDSAILTAPTVASHWTGTGDLRPRSNRDDKVLRAVVLISISLYVIGTASSIITAGMFDGLSDVSFGATIWGNFFGSEFRPIGLLIDSTVCNCVLLVPTIMIHWYINICSWTHERVLFFRERIYALLDDSAGSVSAPEIKSLQNIYSHLWSTVSCLDEKLGRAVFIWNADFILTVILSARGIQKSSTWPTALECSSHFAYSVIFFFIVSLVASNIVVESNNIDYDLCRLVCHINFSDWRASNQIMLLQEEIQQCSLAFTGWNCFTLDRGYILTVVGAVITYAVVLQQLT